MALDFFAGCLGGCAGILVGHPFDTAKVHIQMQDPRNIKYRGTFNCLSQIYAKDSFRGLYKGIVSPIGGVAFVNAIIFGVYGNVQRFHSNPDSLKAHLMAGSLAGLCQSFVSSPMELVKTKMQLQDRMGTNYKGTWDCFQHIWRKGRFKGIFQGLNTTIIRDVPGVGAYFVSYEMMVNKDSGTFRVLMAGGLAGVCSWVLSYPLDVIKTRIQMDSTKQYSGIVDCVCKSYKAEGITAFTRGMSSCLLRAFPTNAACFAVVSLVLRLSDRLSDNYTVKKPEIVQEKSVLRLKLNDEVEEYVTRLKSNSIRGLTLMGAFHEDSIQRTEIYELTNNFNLQTDDEVYIHFKNKRNRLSDD